MGGLDAAEHWARFVAFALRELALRAAVSAAATLMQYWKARGGLFRRGDHSCIPFFSSHPHLPVHPRALADPVALLVIPWGSPGAPL